MNYEPVIGLEIHAELLTHSKMFCSCAVVEGGMGAEPNTHVCPVCMALPGALPVINEQAITYTILTGLALNCQINPFNIFARKNYFYPDLPKGYQISQYEYPLCKLGWLEIETEAGPKKIGITRVHQEEDTGKLTHTGALSLVDLNRAGVPLMEIVSEPDMRSVEEARAYAEKIRHILRYLGVNSGDMEKGVIRFEANVSIRPAGSDRLYTRTEIKNLNSFRALVRAMECEIARQVATVQAGGTVEQETLGWSEEREQIYVQRSKESAHDYRYFPEPDLPPLEISLQRVEALRARLPELPDARRERFAQTYGLSRYQAALLTEERAVADYFESCAAKRPAAGFAALANWMCGDLFRLMKESSQEIGQVKIAPVGLLELVDLVESGTINLNTARSVFEEAFASGRSPRAIVEEKGLAQLSDASTLEALVKQVLDDNPGPVEQYLAGKEGLANWLVGQVMKATRGQANPQIVRDLLKTALNQRRTP
jgi:aspartyl-tRNA(Asn)/glutamyl-tRNA(Gln) amidotransferase subunit B